MVAARSNLDVYAALGLILAITSTQMAARRAMLILGLCGTLCFAAHYARLGSYTGSAICVLAASQALLAAIFVTPEHRPPWIVPVFAVNLLVGFGITALTWVGWASFFAVLGSVFATTGRLQVSVPLMRRLFLAMTLCWWCHDLIMATPLALACETIAAIGFAVAILREPRGEPLAQAASG
jgi:uncharacterized membrane protein YoaK (UPF0700 family)